VSFRVLHDYPRRAHLEFYRRYPSAFYSVCFELEAGLLRRQLKAAGVSTYAGFCWAFHRGLLALESFRVRLAGEDVVLHDVLRLGLTVPAPGRTFSFVNLEWHADPSIFFPAAASAMTRASAQVDLSGGGEAPDFVYYTAVPRLPFTALTHVPLADPAAGQPAIAFGKFREEGERLLVPVGVQVNHMYIDGADLGELHDGVQASFARGL
jgi:chloramphenicol O-acetyltransferase type A